MVVGESSSRKVESTGGAQVTPSSERSSPAGQRHTALGPEPRAPPGASRHRWEHFTLPQGLDTLTWAWGWTTYRTGRTGVMNRHHYTRDPVSRDQFLPTAVQTRLEAERLAGSLEKDSAVLAGYLVGRLDGPSLGVGPVDPVVEHGHCEGAGGLGELEQLWATGCNHHVVIPVTRVGRGTNGSWEPLTLRSSPFRPAEPRQRSFSSVQ